MVTINIKFSILFFLLIAKIAPTQQIFQMCGNAAVYKFDIIDLSIKTNKLYTINKIYSDLNNKEKLIGTDTNVYSLNKAGKMVEIIDTFQSEIVNYFDDGFLNSVISEHKFNANNQSYTVDTFCFFKNDTFIEKVYFFKENNAFVYRRNIKGKTKYLYLAKFLQADGLVNKRLFFGEKMNYIDEKILLKALNALKPIETYIFSYIKINKKKCVSRIDNYYYKNGKVRNLFCYNEFQYNNQGRVTSSYFKNYYTHRVIKTEYKYSSPATSLPKPCV